MSDISKINVGGVDYNVKDNVARQGDTDISDIKKDIKNIQDLDILQNADITALKDDTKNYVKKVNGNTPDTNGNVNISLEELNGAERAHASSTTDYGVGDSNQYGHLKLSDGIQYRDIEDKDIVPTPGVAASKYDTQKMGKELSDRINSIADIGDGDIITSVNNITPIKGTHDVTLTANDIFVNQATIEIKPNSIQDKINKINIEPNPETTEEDISLTSIKIGDITYKIESSSSPSGGQVIQVTSLPEPSAELIGTIYQYIGPSDMSYTNGYFYKCESEEQEITNEENEEATITTTTIYFWNRINVQPSNGGEGGTSNYDELENRPSINGQLLTGDKSLSDLGINNFDGDYEKLTNKPDKFTPEEHTHLMEDIIDLEVGNKVSVSATGESDNEIKYITVDDVEYKIAGGGEGSTVTVSKDGPATEEEKAKFITINNKTWELAGSSESTSDFTLIDYKTNQNVVYNLPYIENNKIYIAALFQSKVEDVAMIDYKHNTIEQCSQDIIDNLAQLLDGYSTTTWSRTHNTYTKIDDDNYSFHWYQDDEVNQTIITISLDREHNTMAIDTGYSTAYSAIFKDNKTSFEQIQSDWTETDEESKAFIQNKPLDLVHIDNDISEIQVLIK